MPTKKDKPVKKEEIAYKHIWEMISSDKYDEGDLLPTEKSIAEDLGINRLTVSKALAWLKKEGYINRRAGYGTVVTRKPPSSNTRLILVISPWPSWEKSSNWYFSRLLYAVHAEALLNNATTVNVAFKYEEEEVGENFNRIRDLFNAVKCEGALVIDPFMSTHNKLIDFLDDLNCPSVWAGSSLESRDGIHKVDIDDYQAAFDLTQKLINDGAKKIAFMGGYLNTLARQQRLEGFKAAMTKNELDFDERYIVCSNSLSYLEDVGNECAGLYAARRLEADALFVNDSSMIKGMNDFCKLYPNESTEKLAALPIASFDFESVESVSNVRYSVEQDIEEMGRQAVQVFLTDFEKDPSQTIEKSIPVIIKEY